MICKYCVDDVERDEFRPHAWGLDIQCMFNSYWFHCQFTHRPEDEVSVSDKYFVLFILSCVITMFWATIGRTLSS